MVSIKTIQTKSLFDFSFLFGSNLLNKIFGFLREIILAFIFGSSLIYSSYLLLKTLTDFLSKFTFGNALQANILPKFTRLYKKKSLLDLTSVYRFSKQTMTFLFFISLIAQLVIIFLFIKDFHLILIFTSIVLSLVLSLNFHNSLFLNIIQAKGDFKKFSIAELSNGFVSTILLYPFILLSSVFGIAFSRLLGIFSLTYFYIRSITKHNNGFKASISFEDFNFSVVFLSNLYLFIFLIARFISGLNSSTDIAFFNYSFLILNVLMTSVIFNVNSIILRYITIKKDLKFFYYSILISTFLSLFIYFFINNFSFDIIDLIFKRGAFNSFDVVSTAYFLQKLTLPFIFLIFTTIFFQPFFSLGVKSIKEISLKFSLTLLLIFIITVVYIFANNINTQKACFLFVNIMSFSSFMVSIFSLRFFLNYEI